MEHNGYATLHGLWFIEEVKSSVISQTLHLTNGIMSKDSGLLFITFILAMLRHRHQQFMAPHLAESTEGQGSLISISKTINVWTSGSFGHGFQLRAFTRFSHSISNTPR